MSEERTNMAIRDLKHYVIDNMSLDVQDDFEIICKYITNLQQKVEQQDKEIEKLNNIINRNDNFVDRTIEIIKQQPTGDDEWILEKLNGIKYLIELKDSDK